MLVDDPGKISFVVMDWDRFSKNDLIGSCEVSASMLKEMCKKMEGEEDLDLVDAKNVPVKGSNKQTAVLRISWQYSGNAA
jgi:Ca2+-dependent lipid-binding protein